MMKGFAKRETGEVLLAVLGHFAVPRPQLRASFGLQPGRPTVLDLADQLQDGGYKFTLN